MALSEVFWISFVASTLTFLGIAVRMCYKSKCVKLECCCMKIQRDVETEERETEFITTHTKSRSSEPIGLDQL